MFDFHVVCHRMYCQNIKGFHTDLLYNKSGNRSGVNVTYSSITNRRASYNPNLISYSVILKINKEYYNLYFSMKNSRLRVW